MSKWKKEERERCEEAADMYAKDGAAAAIRQAPKRPIERHLEGMLAAAFLAGAKFARSNPPHPDVERREQLRHAHEDAIFLAFDEGVETIVMFDLATERDRERVRGFGLEDELVRNAVSQCKECGLPPALVVGVPLVEAVRILEMGSGHIPAGSLPPSEELRKQTADGDRAVVCISGAGVGLSFYRPPTSPADLAAN
jgi:hypothetical protein